MSSSSRPRFVLADALNEHRYPRLLHVRPAALRVYQAVVHATTLRSWYVRREIRRLEDALPAGGTVLDVGCGSGDHLFYVLRRRPDTYGIGIDRSAAAVALCRDHAAGAGLGATFREMDLDERPPLPANDLTLCVGMLQYVEHDHALLVAVRAALPKEGRLLLYVPVRNERILPFYDRLVEGGMLDYDAVQGRRRVYRPEQVRRRLCLAGFRIEAERETYGPAGKIAFELHALVLHGLSRRGIAHRLAAFLGGLLALPLILACMLADYLLPVSRGNGLLIVASPEPDRAPVGAPQLGNISASLA